MPLPQVPENDLDDIPKAGLAKMTSQKSGIDKWPDNQRRMWAAYYATVTYMDEQLGKVLDELERLKLTQFNRYCFYQRSWIPPWRTQFLAKEQPPRGSYSCPSNHFSPGTKTGADSISRRTRRHLSNSLFST
jgi:hypothetical protein